MDTYTLKHPSKARFIIAAPKFSVKLLSKAVTIALKLMYKHIGIYNSESHYFSEVKLFWPVQYNLSVIDEISKFNVRKEKHFQ